MDVPCVTGATGGSSRGITNHFIPGINTGPVELFPGSWKNKVWFSDVGVVAVVALLAYWASQAGVATVAALYLGPYTFVNVWLVLYTWQGHPSVYTRHAHATHHNSSCPFEPRLFYPSRPVQRKRKKKKKKKKEKNGSYLI